MLEVLSWLQIWGPPVAVILATLVVAGKIYRELSADRPTPLMAYKHSWWIQHDEKHLIHEGRILATRPAHEINDYYWPVVSAFGLAAPSLAALGFRLWGVSVKGLRRPFFFLNTLVVLLVLLTLTQAAPWWISLPLAFQFLASLETLTNWRYALPESFLFLYLAAGTLALVLFPDLVWSGLPVLAFVAGLLGAVKISFPVIAGTFLAGILLSQALLTGTLPLMLALMCAAAWMAGWGMIEAIQALIYRRLGIDNRHRWRNLLATIRQHRDDTSQSRSPMSAHQPGRWRVFTHFYYNFQAAYRFVPNLILSGLLILVFLFLGFGAGTAPERPVASADLWALSGIVLHNPALWALVFFFLIHQGLHWPLHWYPKRGIILYYPLVVLTAVIGGQMAAFLAIAFGFWGLFVQGLVSISVPLLAFLFWHRRSLAVFRSGHSEAVQDNLDRLRGWLPDDAVVYADCFAARFLWPDNVRIISSDVVTWRRQDVVDWAEMHGGAHVLLSGLKDVKVEAHTWRVAMEMPFDNMAATEPMTVLLLERRDPFFEPGPAQPFSGIYKDLDAYRASKDAVS